MNSPHHLDVLVIGAGQAGLAMGYHLRRVPCTFELYDRHVRVGDSWRQRHDSLHLFSPRAFSALPGLPLPGDPEGYPSRDEVADYLEEYAQAHDLPVVLGESVQQLESRGRRFLARTSRGRQVSAAAVVVCTGALQCPIVPTFAAELDPRIPQYTPLTYGGPAQLPPGRVLVVGDGATGRQLARELVGTHEVWLSAGKRRLVIPQRLLGRDTMWWFDRLGALRADRNSWLGSLVRSRDAIPGWHLRHSALRREGVRLVPRTVDAGGTSAIFSGGTSIRIDALVWTLGYHDDHRSWLEIPEAFDSLGRVSETRGVSSVPGLFYLGREWQNSRASALLCGAGADAADLLGRSLLPFLRLHTEKR